MLRLYQVAHKNVQNCAMMLYSAIEFKPKKNIFKEQSQLNSMKNYDVIRFVLTVKYAKEYWMYETYKTRCWHVTISCQPDGRPPQPVRPWKSGRVHLAEGSNVVVLELPYSTEFGRDSRKFASGVRKCGKFSHFLTLHPVVYGGQGKNKYYLL